MTDDTTADKASSSATPRSGRASIVMLWLLVLAQAGFSGWLYWQWRYAPSTDSITFERELDALSSELAALNGSAETNGEATRALAADVDKLMVETDDLNSLREQITALQKQTETLEANSLSDERIASMLKVAEKIEAVNQRVEKDQQEKWSQIQMLSALDTLEAALRSGKAYDGAYRAMYLAAGEHVGLLAELRALEPHVSRGIPTLEQLQSSFQESISAYLAARTDTPNQTWSAIKRNLGSLVRVRKVGASHSGADTESHIARAEAALDLGDIASARDEINGISGDDAKAFTAWQKQVVAHLNAEAALSAIREQILLKLGG